MAQLFPLLSPQSMEQKRSEQSMQHSLDFKSKKILPTGEKSGALSPCPVHSTNKFEDQGLQHSILSQTPAKTIEPPRTDVLKDDDREVFDKCKNLTELFDRMDSSVRLLQLCKKLSTFQNICIQVERLTKRKFLYCHLAQIKYILPEAVQIEKVLVHDRKTLCMKPDVKITLLFDAFPAHPDQSASTAMRQVFRARLLDFFDTHPQERDIPEAILPEPFNRTDISLPDSLPVGSPKTSSPAPIDIELLSNSSILSQSYSKCFPKKIIIPDAEKTQLLASAVPCFSEKFGCENNQYSWTSQEKESLASKSTSDKFPAEPIFSPQHSINPHACKSPLERVISVADNFVVETPVQQTPKRLIPSTDDKMITETSEARASSHSAAKRSLNFSALNDDVTDSSIRLEDSKHYGVMLNSCSQTAAKKEILVKEEVLRSPSAISRMEEEKGHLFEGGKMSPKGLEQCQQMLAPLVDLFDIVRIIFQAASFSSITKQELVHKIIWNNCDIIDGREVEQQLELLEKVVPDWIFRKLVPSGDILYCIRKVSDLESIRAKLLPQTRVRRCQK